MLDEGFRLFRWRHVRVERADPESISALADLHNFVPVAFSMHQHVIVKLFERFSQLCRRLFDLLLSCEEDEDVTDRLKQKNLHDGS